MQHDLVCDVTARPAQGAAASSHRWKVLGAGVAANASFIAAANGLPATAIWLRAAYHLDNAGLGLLLGALGIGTAISELPWGAAADRWGDRRVLLAGLTVTGCLLMVMALWLAPSAGTVPPMMACLLCMGLVGAAGGSVNGASGRAVMRWFGEGERGLAMSIRQTAVPLGGGLGALFLPSLAYAFGFGVVYGALAALCLASAWLTWLWLREPDGWRSTSARHAAVPIRNPLRNVDVWRLSLGIGILCAPQFAILSFASVFLHDAAGVGLTGISVTLVLLQFGAMVMRIWSGRHTDRHGNRVRWLRRCTVLAGITFIPLAICATGTGIPAGVAMIAVIVAGIAISAWHGVAYTELATRATAERAGTALGLANTIVFGVYFVTPATLPYLLERAGWSQVWLLIGSCAIVAWGLFPRTDAG